MTTGFAWHMLQHMGLVAVVAPLAAAALAGRRLDPVVSYPQLFAAIPASLVELVVVWAWHAPAMHDAARHDTAVWAAEQASFMAAGLYFWLAILGGTPAHRTAHAGAGMIALVLTFSHMTLLGAILVVSQRPLYAHLHAGDAVTSQHLGGAIMLVVGGLVYIGAGLWLGRRLLRHSLPVEHHS